MKKLFIVLGLLSCSYLAEAQTTNTFPLKLRVASFNVGHFNQGLAGGFRFMGQPGGAQKKEITGMAKRQVSAWRQWLSEQSLDIIGVQEWNKHFDVDSSFNAQEELLKPFYNNVYFGNEHKWIYNGIATNYKLTNLRFKYTHGDYYALIGDLKVGNKTITVISTHIPWQKDWHVPALNAFIEDLKQYEYFICFGDMNSSDAEQMHFREAGFNMANGGHQGWFGTASGTLISEGRQGQADKNIDNIVTSKNIKIMNVSAPRTGINDFDHLPVIADIIITD
ncbi:endonuclease/exonuclease/phosphatase family protein [Dyadobacter sp. CY323]|uniref:endonuclease/exonuclease/phosphatase family protein n=1 Tax=Dyadobacter sp. CY323 TaxID=2907302 RepID=UPI001F1C72C0|nr:endonuclease/exonuclease/phosphatase family protein [Dyadobacter sp. CY323]MCE6991439.1 endonuclease/exonuclease/phosphatase family protein [Dyadobacter sp. CY323]